MKGYIVVFKMSKVKWIDNPIFEEEVVQEMLIVEGEVVEKNQVVREVVFKKSRL